MKMVQLSTDSASLVMILKTFRALALDGATIALEWLSVKPSTPDAGVDPLSWVSSR